MTDAKPRTEPEPLHYTASGLPDVWLLNGFRRVETKDGLGVAIDDIDGLHVALLHAILQDRKPLTGPETRFIRKHLRQSQAAFARILGISDQTVARWEKGETPVDATADRLIRMVLREVLDDDATWLEVLGEMTQQTKEESSQRRLRRTGTMWRAAA